MLNYKIANDEPINKESDSRETPDDEINFFISNSTKNDLNIWIDLIEKFDNNQPQFGYKVDEILIQNSIKTIQISDESIQKCILQFIYRVLQNSKYTRDLFDNLQLHIMICSILSESASDSLKFISFNILDTYLNSINEDDNVAIQWADIILKKINPLINDSNQNKNTILSTILSISTVLLEKGAFSVEEMHQHFIFYSNLIPNLSVVDLYYGIHNLEIILRRYPCFYKQLETSYPQAIDFIYSTLSIQFPDIVISSLNILSPSIPSNLDYFLNRTVCFENEKYSFIQICLKQIQNNDNMKLAFTITKCLIEICSTSPEACDQVVKAGFLRCNDLFRYGFTVQKNLIQIVRQVVQKIPVTFDKYTVSFISNLLNSYISSDDPFCIIGVLDIVIALLKTKFIFDQQLIEDISQLINQASDESIPEIVDKASFIIKEINDRENQVQ